MQILQPTHGLLGTELERFTDRLTRRDLRWQVGLPVLGVALALVCGLIAVLALLDPSDAEMDRIVGTGMFAVAAIVLAGLGLARQKRGQGMSIAGLVLGVIGLLGAIGS